MKKPIAILASTFAISYPGSALAEAPSGNARSSVRAEVAEALESQATLPSWQPTLPDQASDRAREVHATTAFGKKGAEKSASKAAQAAKNASTSEAARRAVDAATQRAGQRGQAAAAEFRTDEARRGTPPSKPEKKKKDR